MRLFGILILAGFLATPAAAQSVKLVDPSCEGPFQRYQAAPGLKAFAAGRNLGCGWQRQGPGFTDIETIRAQAIRQCTANGGDACRIVHQVK
jgi:hypothetical protein